MESNPFVDKTGEFGTKEVAPSTSTPNFMNSADVQGEIAAALETPTKAAPRKWTPPQKQVSEADARTDQKRIEELEAILIQLKAAAGMDGVKVVTPNVKAQLDFTKISEADVFDLNIPIVAIEHHVPDLTRIELKDKNYIARYINVHPGRMGPMRAAGFTFITADDIESIAMDIKPDENGQFRYIDTVAMKCPKIKYLGALRANYERARKVTDKNVLHRIMQKKTAEMLGSNEMGERDAQNPDFGKNFKRDAQKYQAENKLEVYI